MKKHFKIIKKIIIITAIVIAVTILSLYLYIENGSKIYFSKTERENVIIEIQKAPNLPSDFFDFYESVYPESLENSFWKKAYKVSTSFYKIRNDELPSQNIANMLIGSLKKSNFARKRNYVFLTRFIEQNFTQKECVNFYFQNFDYLNNRKGLSTVSQDLFKKEVKDLQPNEIAEIIALSENPVRNNRFTNPEKAKLRTEVLLEKYKNSKER